MNHRLKSGKGRKNGVKRVVRGGSWNDNARNARSAYRNWNPPDDRNDNLGFRCSRAHGLEGFPDMNRPLSMALSGASPFTRQNRSAGGVLVIGMDVPVKTRRPVFHVECHP